MLHVRSIGTGVAGSPYYTNLYFTGEIASAAAALTKVRTFMAALAPNIGSGMTINVQSEVKEIDPFFGNTLAILNGPDQAPIATSGGTTVTPPATQGLIRLATGGVVRNRRVIGRIFVPRVAVGAVATGGSVSAGYQTSVTNAISALIADQAGPRLAVWSRPMELGPIGPVNGSLHAVTSASVWSEFSVLRSRRD